MYISFSPVRSNAKLDASKYGEVLTVNGDALDFSDLPDGGEYPAEAIENDFVIGSVKRVDGAVHITLLLPYSNPTPPQSVAFPNAINLPDNGPVPLPEGCMEELDHAVE